MALVPAVVPPLDPDFRPLALELRAFERELANAESELLEFALEREEGLVSRYATRVFKATDPRAARNYRFVARLVKQQLWQKGGFRVSIAGPKELVERLALEYAPTGARAFDAEFFRKVYEQEAFVVRWVPREELPLERERPRAMGGHFEGCRIGFDAGGSDRKVAALIDGRKVYASEIVWAPKEQSDPEYHFQGINDSIRRAAEHLPRIDAIGVSSAGIYVNNRTRVASLFRKVPEEAFERRIKNLYLDIAEKWGGVPIEVANDGDVTALAGALELGDHPVLGIAMGTSQATGYVDAEGRLTGWLNELAFTPVDLAENAPVDSEWSGDSGTGVNYFSQDAVIRLAKRAGIELREGSPAEKLSLVQALVERGHEGARAIFETIGVYLGYALLGYAAFYELKHVLLLGRVTSGQGGEHIVKLARAVLEREAPELEARVRLHLPDEARRRVGQAIAAASLPEVER